MKTLTEPDALEGWDRLLVLDEYVHAWCGKYRRPAGMITRDFHTPKEPRIELLVINGDGYLKRILELDQGPEHMVLVRDESKPDRLVEIAAPLVRLE